MALMALEAVLLGCLVYGTGAWWGAATTRGDRLAAALLTLAVTIGMALATPASGARWWSMPVIGVLAAVAVIDRRHRVIPNRLVGLLAVWAVTARVYWGGWWGAALVGAGIFLFYIAVHWLTRGGLGMGDVKFSAVMAFALGYPAGLVSMVTGLWAAGLVAAGLLVVNRRRRTEMMALGPFLALGGIIGLLERLHG